MAGSEELEQKLEDLKRLNRNRFDYVLKRSSTNSKAAAYTAAGLSESWYYNFSEDERKLMEDLADELHYEKAIQAELILRDAAPEAAAVKVKGMASFDQRVKQQAATEILDRTIGKPGDNSKLHVEGSINFIWQPHKPT